MFSSQLKVTIWKYHSCNLCKHFQIFKDLFDRLITIITTFERYFLEKAKKKYESRHYLHNIFWGSAK